MATTKKRGKSASARALVAKAIVLGDDAAVAAPSNLAPDLGRDRVFDGAGSIDPPWSFATLSFLYRHTPHLRPNIDVYVANIPGHGHTLKPIIDLDTPDADKKLAEAIYLERYRAKRDPRTKHQPQVIAAAEWPSDAEVAERKKQIEASMRGERVRLEHFFATCCGPRTWQTHENESRQDYEQYGNAWWEVTRDESGEPSIISRAPVASTRIMPEDPWFTPVRERQRVGLLGFDMVDTWRRFRRHVQESASGRQFTYFKSLGDPRVMSADNGQYYGCEDKAHDAEHSHMCHKGPLPQGHRAATEMMWWPLYDSEYEYGVPRWSGVELDLVGSREASEYNHGYFKNNGMPKTAVILRNLGTAGAEMKKGINGFLEDNRGTRNSQKALMITLPGNTHAEAGNQQDVEFKSLAEHQQKDGQFLAYDQRVGDKTGMAFRLSRILRGDATESNRATAREVLRVTDPQVFAPERREHDERINRELIPLLNIRYWAYESNGPDFTDPEAIGKSVAEWKHEGILSANDARPFAKQVLGRDIAPHDDGDTLGGGPAAPAPVAMSAEQPEELAAKLVRARELFEAAERDRATAAFKRGEDSREDELDDPALAASADDLA